MNNINRLKKFIYALSIASFFCFSTYAQESKQEAPIVQPGAPGEETKDIDPETASNIADTSYTPDDVNFLQGMIIHHHQATVMSNWADQRTNSKSILDLYMPP